MRFLVEVVPPSDNEIESEEEAVNYHNGLTQQEILQDISLSHTINKNVDSPDQNYSNAGSVQPITPQMSGTSLAETPG